MDTGAKGARSAWARLLDLQDLERLLVIVAPRSPLCPPGWIGILGMDRTLTAVVPRPELRAPVAKALDDLSDGQAVDPDIVRARVAPTRQVLGPGLLFYPPPSYEPEDPGDVELVPPHEMEALLARLPWGEVAESGLAGVTSPLFGSRTAAGELAAVCGYRRWSNDVAHLSALADPVHRLQGHARRASAAAIRQALSQGLLPQWRARPVASQAVARSLGLVQYGAQLSLELA